MNDFEKSSVTMSDLPHATIQKKKGISIVWLIPVVAVIIAAGLVYKALNEKGPRITISFKTAEGLEAGKTKIKYKDVTVGQVEAIRLSPDLKNIIVTAQLVKPAKVYLTENTRFWVVRARLSGGVVTGLGTLFSGSYIAIDPSKEGEFHKHFSGLEIPPIITSDLPGTPFQLRAPQLNSLQYGSPIYFKGIKVGQVAAYKISDKGEGLDIDIFIEEPYDKNVFETTRFWFATGLDIDLDANGMRIDTQSFVSMMIGGIAFSNNYQAENGPIAKDGKTFVLYESSEDAMTLQYAKKDYYLLKFDHSVRGLAIGAPVEFKGFPIGKVVDIWLERNKDNNHIVIPVKIEVEPERINQLEKSQKDATGALKMMVNQGMRAQLKKGNILTGSLYVALDFFKNPNPASLVVHENIIELPTIPATLDELTGNLTTLLSKLAKIPMEEIGSTTLDTIKSLNKTSKSFKQAGDSFTEIMLSSDLKKAIHSFNQSLANLEELTYELEQNLGPAVSLVSEKTFATLDEIQKITASDSAVMFELKRALIELGKAAQSIQHLADQLERHPESIIQGKGKE